jgi:hypothetical protein
MKPFRFIYENIKEELIEKCLIKYRCLFISPRQKEMLIPKYRYVAHTFLGIAAHNFFKVAARHFIPFMIVFLLTPFHPNPGLCRTWSKSPSLNTTDLCLTMLSAGWSECLTSIPCGGTLRAEDGGGVTPPSRVGGGASR